MPASMDCTQNVPASRAFATASNPNTGLLSMLYVMTPPPMEIVQLDLDSLSPRGWDYL
jgi:hypothetical protein